MYEEQIVGPVYVTDAVPVLPVFSEFPPYEAVTVAVPATYCVYCMVHDPSEVSVQVSLEPKLYEPEEKLPPLLGTELQVTVPLGLEPVTTTVHETESPVDCEFGVHETTVDVAVRAPVYVTDALPSLPAFAVSPLYVPVIIVVPEPSCVYWTVHELSASVHVFELNVPPSEDVQLIVPVGLEPDTAALHDTEEPLVWLVGEHEIEVVVYASALPEYVTEAVPALPAFSESPLYVPVIVAAPVLSCVYCIWHEPSESVHVPELKVPPSDDVQATVPVGPEPIIEALEPTTVAVHVTDELGV